MIGEPLPFNSEDYSTGHPALSRDGTSLYFISDMPWGYGGTDIYRVQWLGNGQWSAPQNLGLGVNTEGNELFPFVLNDSILYFASDGHFGLGGLDIYESRFRDGLWTKAENLGVPVNSSADDFSFIADSTGNKGYFSSVRNGVNDRIYSFEKHPPQLFLDLKVSDAKSGFPVSQARITLDSPGVPESTYLSNAAGLLRLSVQPGTDYRLRCDHPDYFMVSTEASTYGKKFSETITLNVEMRKVELNTPFTWQGLTFRKKDQRWRPASVESLNSLTELLKNNPRLIIDVESYTDARGQDAENLTLTQQRADLVRQFLIDNGVAASRLTAKGFGETKPIADNTTELGRKLNRRTEFVILSK
jgi:outer membrane protein OmpA-like peptidoglycan-associated protein